MQKVAISGCCVSRDAFNFDRNKTFDVSHFIQFNPISCQNTDSNSGIFMPDAFNDIKFQSNFVKKCASYAMSNNMLESILNSDADTLIIDLADERIPKAHINDGNSLITIAKHSYYAPLIDAIDTGALSPLKLREFPFNALDWTKVVENYTNFALKVKEKFGEENIIIIEVYMGNTFINSNHEIQQFSESNSGFSLSYISDVNEYLKKCYALLETLLPGAKKIKLPDNSLTISFHRWGFNPLHFTSETYEYLIKCVEILTGNSNENSLDCLYEELKLKNRIISYTLKHMDVN